MIKISHFAIRAVLVCTLFGLAAMFIASFVYRSGNSSLYKQPKTQQAAAPTSGFGSSGPMNTGMTAEMMSHIGELMAKLRDTPDSFEVRMELASHFMEANDWTSAALHIKKALSVKDTDYIAWYNLAICQYKSADFSSAAESFEKVLSLEKEDSAKFNLALLYRNHLDKPERASELLKQILDDPKAESEVKNMAQNLLDAPIEQ